MFSVVNAVLLRALPYRDPQRIVVLCEHNVAKPGAMPCNSLNPGNFLYWRDVSKSFESLGAFVDVGASVSAASHDPVAVQARLANASVFTILGARAAAGRLFTDAEDREGGPNVMVLSHAFWRQYFGGDSSIVGKPVTMNASTYTVVGVTQPGFGIYDPVDVWFPMRFTAQHRVAPGRYLRGVARLAPGVSLERAIGDMALMAAQRAHDSPAIDNNWSALVVPLRNNLVGDTQRTLWVLLGAVGFLLLIACANVANLLLARAADREREIAVRISLGASPARIVRQLLTESVVLSLFSALVGLAIAVKGTQALVALVPSGMSVQTLADVSVDWSVLAFTLVVALITGLVFGLAPAYHAVRGGAQESLKSGGRGSTTSRSSARVRNALVVAEMSLALMLLAGAGLMVRSFAALEQVRLGFDPNHVLTARVSLPGRRYPNDTLTLAFFRAAEQRVAALPGVSAVGAISYLPLTGQRSASGFNVEGRPAAAAGAEPIGDMRAVTPGYFGAMGISIKDGRNLEETDVANSPAVGVVSETLARTFWPNESAVGHYLLYEWNGSERVRIVGVAADVHHGGPDQAAYMEIYRPLAQFPYSAMTLVVRGVVGDPTSYVAPLRDAVRSIDARIPLAEVRTMNGLVSQSLGRTRLSTMLFGLFGALGLLLAAVGIYGVMSYTVQQRRHEIGVRMALGAHAVEVVGMVVRGGARLVLAGIVIGSVGGLLGTRLMENLLFGVPPGDRLTFVVTAAVLGGVGLLAAYLPARRATRVDPVAVLRGE